MYLYFCEKYLLDTSIRTAFVYLLFSDRYMSAVEGLLTSVQKTEESLKRLKRIRDKPTGVSTSENQGTSDDEKIRIQLRIDVLSYIKMVSYNLFTLENRKINEH